MHSTAVYLDFRVNRIFDASIDGDFETIKKLFQIQLPFQREQVLYFLCTRGHLEIVKYVLSKDQTISLSRSFLGAVIRGHLDIIEYLMSVREISEQLRTDAFVAACKHGHLHLVRYLISTGIDAHINNEFAFLRACAYNQLEVVKYLTSQNTDIHVYNECALVSVLRNNNDQLATHLISCGADVSKIYDDKMRDHAFYLQQLVNFVERINIKRATRARKTIYEFIIKYVYTMRSRSCNNLLKYAYNQVFDYNPAYLTQF